MCFEEPALDRSQRDSADYRSALSVSGLHRSDNQCKRSDGLVQEDVFGCETQPALAGAGHNLDAEDGVSPKLKEIVLDAYLFHTQHLLPHVDEFLLSGCAGSHVLRLRLLRAVGVG